MEILKIYFVSLSILTSHQLKASENFIIYLYYKRISFGAGNLERENLSGQIWPLCSVSVKTPTNISYFLGQVLYPDQLLWRWPCYRANALYQPGYNKLCFKIEILKFSLDFRYLRCSSPNGWVRRLPLPTLPGKQNRPVILSVDYFHCNPIKLYGA